ncbi:GNAT family N-acetyltransferase [Salipaludibacillus keqinensis]|uniref:GNAT family N-acetyltransferase n=1 Tax=Salipaludibacillus keqinensis TaxID=2045207 RepID=A0A323TAJ5_9BACI|nr:GNAT family N-acetyltransferase [Salipaludibacillus keqinensis]PYZ92050.1 GNAT family N-acetyltransferase [Salipaludibacillus keqinensis]
MELILHTNRLNLAACSHHLFPLMQKELYDTHPHITAHLDQLEKNPTLYGWGPWLILQANHQHIVGDIGFKGKPDHRDSLEVGYGIRPQYQNNGFATEALEGLIDWAFNQKHVRSVTAQCRHDNYSSIRVLEKVHMLPMKEEFQMIHWCRKANILLKK